MLTLDSVKGKVTSAPLEKNVQIETPLKALSNETMSSRMDKLKFVEYCL